jgi:hypothetical protein
MTNENLRMQMLSGVITEGEYKTKLQENKVKLSKTTKKPLKENFVGIGMVGNIFDRKKTDYEIAFEHYAKGNSLTGLGLEENYRDEEFASDMRRNLGYDEEYKNPTTMTPDELEQFKNSAKKDDLGETMVNPNINDRVSYLVHTLEYVWGMGKGNNSIDFKDMAKSLVNDMFDNEEDLDESFLEENEDVKRQDDLDKLIKTAEKQLVTLNQLKDIVPVELITKAKDVIDGLRATLKDTNK